MEQKKEEPCGTDLQRNSLFGEVIVGKSLVDIDGYGLFAGTDFFEGEKILEEDTCVMLGQARERESFRKSYPEVAKYTYQKGGAFYYVKGLLRYVNNGDTEANCEISVNGTTKVTLRALRDIKRGEEFLIEYVT